MLRLSRFDTRYATDLSTFRELRVLHLSGEPPGDAWHLKCMAEEGLSKLSLLHTLFLSNFANLRAGIVDHEAAVIAVLSACPWLWNVVVYNQRIRVANESFSVDRFLAQLAQHAPQVCSLTFDSTLPLTADQPAQLQPPSKLLPALRRFVQVKAVQPDGPAPCAWVVILPH